MLPVAAAACIAPALVGSASASPTSPTPTTESASVCMASQVKVGLVRSFAAGGTAGGFIGFTNGSDDACRLSGWPALVAIGPDGRSFAARRVLGTIFGPYGVFHGPPVLTLDPGHRADAVFVVGDGPGPRPHCPPPYRYIRVSPPQTKGSALLSAWLPDLGGYLPSCTPIYVSMVVGPGGLYHG